MPKNGITVHRNGEDLFIDLSERQADRIGDLADVVDCFPPPHEYTGRLPEAEIKQRTERSEQYEKIGADFQAQLKRIADLDKRQMAQLIAFLDLIEFGDVGNTTETNWALEFINSLLTEVIFDGPVGVLHSDPREFLVDLANDMFGYWSHVRSIRESVKNNPAFFPELRPPAAHPESVKAPRARKARKNAA